MVAYGAVVLLVLAVSTLLLFRFFVHKPQNQVYIDEDIKEKRRKIMEKKAKKA
jgi:Na+/H+ antiporter NhaD/arsenite permease-like protein